MLLKKALRKRTVLLYKPWTSYASCCLAPAVFNSSNSVIIFFKSNLRFVDIYQNQEKLGNTTHGNAQLVGTVNKSFCVLSLEVNIFNYVFHLHRGIVWRVEEFNVTTMHWG